MLPYCGITIFEGHLDPGKARVCFVVRVKNLEYIYNSSLPRFQDSNLKVGITKKLLLTLEYSNLGRSQNPPADSLRSVLCKELVYSDI